MATLRSDLIHQYDETSTSLADGNIKVRFTPRIRQNHPYIISCIVNIFWYLAFFVKTSSHIRNTSWIQLPYYLLLLVSTYLQCNLSRGPISYINHFKNQVLCALAIMFLHILVLTILQGVVCFSINKNLFIFLTCYLSPNFLI